MDRLEAMRVFVAVAELKGFAPAARRLKVSAPAVTRLVASLEQHLGARLLNRTTRQVSLTDAGARYLERAQRILADIAEAEGAAQAERTVPTGHFAVAAPNVFGRLHVAPLMCQYLTRFPNVIGDLTLSDRVVNLVEDGVDVGVRIGNLEDSSHVARLVGATRRVVVASPKYLATNRKLSSPEHLAQHDIIQFTALSPLPDWHFALDGETQRIAFTPKYITNSADAAIAHATAGGGLTLVLAYQVMDAVRTGRLKVVLERHELPALPIHLVYPSTRLLSAKVRTFVDLVRSTCNWQFVNFN